MLRPLPPWRSVPAYWVCAQCGKPATGTLQDTGMIVFYCDDHYIALSDWMLDDLDLGGVAGYAAVRHSWSNWLWGVAHRRPWRVRQRIRARRKAAASAAFFREAFGDVQPIGLIDRARGSRLGSDDA